MNTHRILTAGAAVAAETLRQLDRLVQRHASGNVGQVKELVGREAEDVAIDPCHALEAPVLRLAADPKARLISTFHSGQNCKRISSHIETLALSEYVANGSGLRSSTHIARDKYNPGPLRFRIPLNRQPKI